MSAADPLAAFVELLADAVAARLRSTTAPTVTLEQAAARCNCTVRCLSDARRRGEVRAIRRGRAFVFAISDLDAWTPSATTTTKPHLAIVDPIEASIAANRLTRSGR